MTTDMLAIQQANHVIQFFLVILLFMLAWIQVRCCSGFSLPLERRNRPLGQQFNENVLISPCFN